MIPETLIAWTLWAAPHVAADLETARLARQGRPNVVVAAEVMPRPSRAWAAAVAKTILERPLGAELGPRYEALHWLVWAFHESGYNDRVRSTDGLDSVCSMQVIVASGPFTAEQVLAAPALCVELARDAMGRSKACDPAHPMACYAAGPALAARHAGVAISDARARETERNFRALIARPDAP